MSKILFRAGVGALLAAALVTQASAHAHLVASEPANNAMGAAPKTIALHFSETLMPKFSKIEVSMNGAAVPVKAEIAKDTMTAVPASPFAPGTYQVKWHAVTADSHSVDGTVSFMVH
ncbi:MAG: hypothetical protein BGN86_08685 [Caulobacterales bacterium 68-7]|jgi:methionine-rich copper-binding protein CopC|nr:MAG: hypothetical protein BGN86_08685 [Caulobacterales bacterium 68-7]